MDGDQVVHVFDEEHRKVALERQQMYPAHRRCPPPTYDWAVGPVCGCGSPLLGSNPPLGGKGEQMPEDDTYLKIPLPDELGPEAKLYLGPGKWYKWMWTTGWEPIDNPDIEPFWGDPVPADPEEANAEDVALFGQDKVSWTPLKRGERVIITGGEHFINWLGSAQGEMMDGTESIMIDGKDSPWWFSPKYISRVSDLTSNEVEAVIKMGPGHIMRAMPDTDYEHELAAGVYGEDAVDECKQLVLALPISRLPITSATGYIFGDEVRPSKLVEWAMDFIKKQMDYGDGANDLGLEGQYAELHRKITKLRRAMWEGVELVNEPLNEVLGDLVGHCFLAMMYNDNPGIVKYRKGGKK